MDFQQPHRYMRPPPPPPPLSMAADPHHELSQRLPVPPPGPWYSGQFQYQTPPQHSPSPPPPSQWGPPAHSDHLSYPLANQPTYPAHPLPNPYPPLPPRPHLPPPPPPHPHSQYPQSYSQDWANPNWGYHQSWEYPAHNNEEDWAARARAWAAAKAATDNQQQQLHLASVSRMEEQSNYHDQYPHTLDTPYADVQQPPIPASGYQQYPASAAPAIMPPVSHLQESSSVCSVSSSYVPGGHLPFTARDGSMAGDSNTVFPQQGSSSASPSVHQQEVPSSYSSIAGKEETGNQNEKSYKSSPFPIISTPQQHVQPPVPPIGRSVLMEQAPYIFGNQSAEATSDLSDKPLDFAPRFNHGHDLHVQPSYINHPGGSVRGLEAMPPIHPWTPAVSGVVYPPAPSALPSGPQVDPSVAVPSSVSGHSTAIFGRMTASSLQPTIPSVGGTFGVGAGTTLHPTSAFPVDACGASNVSERPKKASVPNWLREEIIKKTVISSAAPELPKEETQSIEDEGVDKSFGKGDLADRKSIDSSRSTEEEDDDEDDVETGRTAAINQEIKRVLTEVLLKVTDELFDEIATKVLTEDDITDEVDHNMAAAPDREVAPPTPAAITPKVTAKVLVSEKAKETDSVLTPKATSKVLISANAKETDSDDGSEKSSFSSPGDILGLANYASDGDEDDESNKKNTVSQQPAMKQLSDDIHAIGNGSLRAESEEHTKKDTTVVTYPGRMSPNGFTGSHTDVISDFSDNLVGRDSAQNDARSRYSSKIETRVTEGEASIDDGEGLNGFDVSKLKSSVAEKATMKIELPTENSSAKKSVRDYPQGREIREKKDRPDRHGIESASGKGILEVESGKGKTYEKGDEEHKRQDEKRVRKERADDRSGLRERTKEQDVKSGEKIKDSESRRRPTHPDVEDRKEMERDRRGTVKEESDRKRARIKDEKGEKLRHKHASDSSRHKRQRSSSVGSRGRNSKGNSSRSHAKNSNDESSDDSERKLHSRRRNLSPSPVGSRRRQASRSPHSKHSQRRHSPHSSLETTRTRRSRSRSPIRRKR